MHFSLWKSVSYCASLIMEKKSRRRHDDESEVDPSILIRGLQEALEEASEDGVRPASLPDQESSSGTLARLNAQKEFVIATALAAGPTFDSCRSIPNLDQAFSKFLTMYPKFLSSEKIDHLRSSEYSHLSGQRVCLDYCGFGLFSLTQHWESSAFTLSEITANLSNQVLHSGPDVGMVEHDMKARIMDYLNVPETEYGLVFTTSRGSAFRLLSESYPFGTCANLLTMFDHESQSVNWMAERARGKGARVQSAGFEWPTLKLCSADLQKQISKRRNKRKGRDPATGLFAFPVQSRVTGAKYSYQWMALAQQNNWHVLLDAGALGPKDMDSLGLSLFRPDFIIASFYRVFGYDPTGFGCLLIKKSVMSCLQNGSGRAGPGMVRIVPIFPLYLSDSVGEDNDEVSADGIETNSGGKRSGSQLPAFSGAYTSAQVRDMFESEMNLDNSSDKDESSTYFEESESISIGEMMKSPVFSEDESFDSSLWIDLGFSPLGSDNAGPPFKHKVASSSPLPPAWFSSRNNNNNNKLTKLSHSPIREKGSNLDRLENMPVFQEAKLFQDIAEEEQVFEGNNLHFQEIKEEPNIVVTGPTSEKERAIRRETEGGFRLLERREKGRSREGRRVSFNVEENGLGKMSHSVSFDDDGYTSNGEYGDLDSSWADAPEIICEHLDHADMLGLSRTTSRLRFLINWLVSSLLRLRLSGEDGPLVHIYGPKIKYERGAAVAFNIKDRNNRGLISPEVVQKLAEFNDIMLGVGILSHVRILERHKGHGRSLNLDDTTLCKPMENGISGFVRVEVVTASLGFLSNFEDVYRLWDFVAKFLDPDFVKEGGVLPTMAKEVEG